MVSRTIYWKSHSVSLELLAYSPVRTHQKSVFWNYFATIYITRRLHSYFSLKHGKFRPTYEIFRKLLICEGLMIILTNVHMRRHIITPQTLADHTGLQEGTAPLHRNFRGTSGNGTNNNACFCSAQVMRITTLITYYIKKCFKEKMLRMKFSIKKLLGAHVYLL